jgi:hypothetical protein
MKQASSRKIFRILIILIWIALFAGLLGRDYFVKTVNLKEAGIIKRAREESFTGVYFKNERIGYVKHRLRQADGILKLEQEAHLNLNILDEVHPIQMRINADLDTGLLLKSFDFKISSPFYKMTAKGTVEGTDIHLTLVTGKEEIKDVIHLNSPPVLSTIQRSYLLTDDLQVGDRIRVPYFDPVSLAGKDTIMEYKGLEKILIHGRIHRLHHFVESFSGVKINSWLDESGKVIKEESPAGFTFIAEPEYKATDIVSKGSEILTSVSIPITGAMPDLSRTTTIRYKLVLPEDGDFELNQDRQSFDGNILTVQLESLPANSAQPCAGQDEALESTPYIQSGNVIITGRSSKITENSGSAMEKIHILSDWIYENIEKRPVLGIPDAITTLNSGIGDCNEHAALFAALSRSAAIPTRVVAGVTFFEGAFFYHAWNEVCIDDQWISIDTTRNQFPADVSHIKFVVGETQEQIRIGALLGKLQIEVMENQ